tara:strand:- start:41 stop:400 length:360 start_codon:yes stop_codon:yes gene_type:complete
MKVLIYQIDEHLSKPLIFQTTISVERAPDIHNILSYFAGTTVVKRNLKMQNARFAIIMTELLQSVSSRHVMLAILTTYHGTSWFTRKVGVMAKFSIGVKKILVQVGLELNAESAEIPLV